MDFKYIFVVDGVVVSTTVGHEGSGLTITGPVNATRFVREQNSPISIFWTVEGEGEGAVFSPPAAEGA